MKLRNKLIPLASGLVTVATVAPVSLTACSSAGWTDLKDGFTPGFSRLAVEGNELDTKKGEQVYFNAISENPDIFAQDYNWTMSLALRAVSDWSDSLLDSAKQSVTNVKVGKTKINYETVSGKYQEEEFYTLSFTYTREQQYTWNHVEDIGGGESQVSTVGQTTYSFEVNNMPMNFFRNYFNTLKLSDDTLGGKGSSMYSRFLGRGIFGNDKMIEYLLNHSMWHLSLAMAIDMTDPTDPEILCYNPLQYMTDPWSVKYSYKTNDTHTFTYNDVTATRGEQDSVEGYADNSTNLVDPDPSVVGVLQELATFTSASFYMSDITNSDVKK